MSSLRWWQLTAGLLALGACVVVPSASKPGDASRAEACESVVPAACARRSACGTQDVMACRKDWLWRCPVAPESAPAGTWDSVRRCREAIVAQPCTIGFRPVTCESLSGIDWAM